MVAKEYVAALDIISILQFVDEELIYINNANNAVNAMIVAPTKSTASTTASTTTNTSYDRQRKSMVSGIDFVAMNTSTNTTTATTNTKTRLSTATTSQIHKVVIDAIKLLTPEECSELLKFWTGSRLFHRAAKVFMAIKIFDANDSRVKAYPEYPLATTYTCSNTLTVPIVLRSTASSSSASASSGTSTSSNLTNSQLFTSPISLKRKFATIENSSPSSNQNQAISSSVTSKSSSYSSSSNSSSNSSSRLGDALEPLLACVGGEELVIISQSSSIAQNLKNSCVCVSEEYSDKRS